MSSSTITSLQPVVVINTSPSLGSLVHLRDRVAVQLCLERRNRVDFGDDDVCAQTGRPPCNALADVAISGHDDVLAGYQYVCRPYDAVKRRLPGAIDIVKVVLCFRVVDSDYRVSSLPPFCNAP